MSAAKIKELKNVKTVPLFLFLDGQMHLNPSVYFHCDATDWLNLKLATKYTD